ncbi:hypothetical protein ET532_012160 [Verminephrobacter sp. Larva24]|nr:hypothetical protein ET532_012160 [Verminephrobacter sp. Larva24]
MRRCVQAQDIGARALARMARQVHHRHPQAVARIAPDRGLHGAAARPAPGAMRQRKVLALDLAPGNLRHQCVHRGTVPGNDHQAAGVLVQPMDDAGPWQQQRVGVARQQAEVAKRVALADVVISTALIPGRAAPTLITADMVKSMKPGSVIVDIAAGKGPGGVGGNCPLSEADKTVVQHGVTIVGATNLAALVAADASALYARNVLDFLKLIINREGALHIDLQDDIVAACLMTHEGAVRRA